MAKFSDELSIGYVELNFDGVKELSYENINKTICHTSGIRLSDVVKSLNSIIETIGDGYLIDDDPDFFIKGLKGSMVLNPNDNNPEYVWKVMCDYV